MKIMGFTTEKNITWPNAIAQAWLHYFVQKQGWYEMQHLK